MDPISKGTFPLEILTHHLFPQCEFNTLLSGRSVCKLWKSKLDSIIFPFIKNKYNFNCSNLSLLKEIQNKLELESCFKNKYYKYRYEPCKGVVNSCVSTNYYLFGEAEYKTRTGEITRTIVQWDENSKKVISEVEINEKSDIYFIKFKNKRLWVVTKEGINSLNTEGKYSIEIDRTSLKSIFGSQVEIIDIKKESIVGLKYPNLTIYYIAGKISKKINLKDDFGCSKGEPLVVLKGRFLFTFSNNVIRKWDIENKKRYLKYKISENLINSSNRKSIIAFTNLTIKHQWAFIQAEGYNPLPHEVFVGVDEEKPIYDTGHLVSFLFAINLYTKEFIEIPISNKLFNKINLKNRKFYYTEFKSKSPIELNTQKPKKN